MYELVPDVDLLLYMFWFLISRIARSLALGCLIKELNLAAIKFDPREYI